METKYQLLKRKLRKAAIEWEEHPLSNSAKAAYLEAKQNMLNFLDDPCSILD